MSIHYLISLKQQLLSFVSSESHAIKYPVATEHDKSIRFNLQSCLQKIRSSSPNQAALMAFNVLPIYVVLPSVIVNEVISMLLPHDRIVLSHCCHHFRDMIISPFGLSDLWLYIYHVHATKQERPSVSKTRSTFLAHSIFSSNHSVHSDDQHGPSPSHATSLPNTLANSTAMSSRQHSVHLFPASSSGSSHQTAPTTPPPSCPSTKLSHLSIGNGVHRVDRNHESLREEAPCSSPDTPSSSSCSSSEGMTTTTLEKCNSSESSLSSTDQLLEHPSNPTLTSKIIYWPNYKEVLACDFPAHWKRRNPFYQNLCILGKNCGGAHIRVFEVGVDRLPQILSRISPMLLSLCFLNIHRINLDAHTFRCLKSLSYLAYQYITKVRGDFNLHIPSSVVALEFTSCSFHCASFITDVQVLPNVKFLQICNCRFTNYSFQKLLTMCPNLVHLSITTSSWDGIIALPSSLLSVIWKHNEGDFTVRHCHNVWEVSLTIYDSAMMEQLEHTHSLQQLVIATPLFKDFESEMKKPWSFSTQQITPYYNATSPSIRSLSHISLSPMLPAISHRMSSHNANGIGINLGNGMNNNLSNGNGASSRTSISSVRTLNNLDYNARTNGYDKGNGNGNGREMELGSIQSVSRSASIMSMSSVSLDSDDEEESNEAGRSGDDSVLRIVCFQDLIEKEWFTKQFRGDHIKFDPIRVKNPRIEDELTKLNPIFVQEMRQTTQMFHISFPFF